MIDIMLNSLNHLFLGRLIYRNKPSVGLNDIQKNSINNFLKKIDKNSYKFINNNCLCGEKHSVLISCKDRYNININTYLCLNCGVMFTNPIMDDKSLEKFYNDDYRGIYEGKLIPTEEYYNFQEVNGRGIFKFVNQSIKIQKDMKVVDIGCGAGGNLIPFKESGCDVMGLELNTRYVEFANNKGLKVINDSAENINSYDFKADLIILSHILEHLSNPIEFLDKLKSALNPNGLIYIEVPGIFNIKETYNSNILSFLQNAHIFHFTLETLERILQESGFKLVNGNKYVRSLFKMETTDRAKINNKSYTILLFLYYLELKHVCNFLRKKILQFYK